MTHNFFDIILSGTKTTLSVSLVSLGVGLILGLLMAAGELKHSPLKIIFYLWNLMIRGLPEIFVIFVCYFGITLLLTQLTGHYVNINAFDSGVIALSIIFAAYASQIFIAAYHTLPKGELLAADALALPHWQIVWKIILPHVWRHALPGLFNLWLVLLKDSSIVSLIGLKEIMNEAHVAASESFQPFTYYLFAGLIYLVLTTLSSLISKFIERRWLAGIHHA